MAIKPTQGVGNVVQVRMNFDNRATAVRTFNTALLLGTSGVIEDTPLEFTSATAVFALFGATPEYSAASLYFSQKPRAGRLYIGAWHKNATAGKLRGGILEESEKAMTFWTSVTDGSFKIELDGGTAVEVTAIDLSSEIDINGVAFEIQTKLRAATATLATVTYDGSKFVITSATTGATSSVNYLEAAATGTDLSVKLRMTEALALTPLLGADAETATQAVARHISDPKWYAMTIIDTEEIPVVDRIAIAQLNESSNIFHMWFDHTKDKRVGTTLSDYSAGADDELKSQMISFTTGHVNNEGHHEVAAIMGIVCGMDFRIPNNMYTTKFKTLVGVTPLNLTETQASNIDARNMNYYAAFNDGSAIYQQGVMYSGAYTDETHALHWLSSEIQTRVFNLLKSTRKLPQTNAGLQMIVNQVALACRQAVRVGFLAPGQWNQQGIGSIKEGDYLQEGFYIYVPNINEQSQTDREQRIAPNLTVLGKTAGGIHFALINGTIER